MKKILLLATLLLIGFSTQAQTKKNKNAKITIEVDGVCGMCKKRIETAALKTKGVKFALWNIKTHQLNMIVDERKTTLLTIQKNIAAVGHDTPEVKATDVAYEAVHPCCKYRSKDIQLEHEGMKPSQRD